MPDKYFDVIVIGRSLGTLAAAALLARRDFTVLLVRHGRRSADYAFEGRTLRRRAFTMLGATSPVWRRITAELAQTQTWQQRTIPLSPMLQLIDPRTRFEVPPDNELFRREIAREYPEVRRLVGDLYANFSRVAALADSAFDRDVVWPPGTFLERRQTGRIASTLPYARAEPHADLLAEFPRRHPYRHIVTETVRFASDLAGRPPAFAVARLHAAWTRGVYALEGGERELFEMLEGRVEANGGERLDGERVASIEAKRGQVSGVLIDGDTRPIGAGWIIADLTGEEIAVLSGGQGISKKAQRDWPRVVPATMRYVVSLVVRREGIPAPLGREAFVFPVAGTFPHTIHLQRASGRGDEVLLVAEVLRSERDPLPLREARGWVVRQLCRCFPFLERHLVVVDSTHDGLPLWWYDGEGRPREVDRTALGAAAARTESMDRQLEVDPPGYLGLGGEPLRGPIGRTLLAGASVLPGLGQEGQLLAASGAARVVTQSDRRKARMRREMWTKLEIS
jgi:phytoene dehydrogenase-like protein